MLQLGTFRHGLLIACIGGVLIGPSTAAAASSGCVSLPGRSGLDEYCESLPTVGGGPHHNHPGGGAPPQVPKRVVRALSHQGATGKAILELTRSAPSASAPVANVTAPSVQTVGSPKARHHGTASRHAHPSTPAPSASAVEHRSNGPIPDDNPAAAIVSGAGVGGPFLWVMVGVSVLLCAAAWLARRQRMHRA